MRDTHTGIIVYLFSEYAMMCVLNKILFTLTAHIHTWHVTYNVYAYEWTRVYWYEL